MVKNSYRIGLSLSGGGYRAAAFHLGTLRKLKQLGILHRINCISTVSGGSITGAYYLLHKDKFEDLALKLRKSTEARILFSPKMLLRLFIFIGLFVSTIALFNELTCIDTYSKILSIATVMLIVIIIIIFFLHSLIPLTKIKADIYNQLFFNHKKIKDLNCSPEININAANLETGSLWTFSQRNMWDSGYNYPSDGGDKICFINHNEFSISLAVASSTAIPQIFNPVKIPQAFFSSKNNIKRALPLLVDGGVYDNQGLYRLISSNSTTKCNIIICSDASAPFEKKFKKPNPLFVMLRSISVLRRRVKNIPLISTVYERKNEDVKEIALFSLDWSYQKCIKGYVRNFIDAISDAYKYSIPLDQIYTTQNIPKEYYENCSDINEQEIYNYLINKYKYLIENGCSNDEIKKISKINTRLKALLEKEIGLLMQHAEVLTEIQIRLYCPSLLEKGEHNGN